MKLIRIEDERIYYKKMLSEKEVVVDRIVNCYKRVEEASATTCCSRSDFSMVFLMLVLEDQSVLKLETTEAVCDITMEKIKEINPQVVVGYQKK